MRFFQRINYLLWALADGGKPLAIELMLAMKQQNHPSTQPRRVK